MHSLMNLRSDKTTIFFNHNGAIVIEKDSGLIWSYMAVIILSNNLYLVTTTYISTSYLKNSQAPNSEISHKQVRLKLSLKIL